MCGRGDGDEQRWWWLYVKLTRPEICGATRQPRSGERSFEKIILTSLGLDSARLAGDLLETIRQLSPSGLFILKSWGCQTKITVFAITKLVKTDCQNHVQNHSKTAHENQL